MRSAAVRARSDGKSRSRRDGRRSTRSGHSTFAIAGIHGLSISLSARASTLGGIFRPIRLAVFRLMTNSNFAGWWTGRSAGFAEPERTGPDRRELLHANRLARLAPQVARDIPVPDSREHVDRCRALLRWQPHRRLQELQPPVSVVPRSQHGHEWELHAAGRAPAEAGIGKTFNEVFGNSYSEDEVIDAILRLPSGDISGVNLLFDLMFQNLNDQPLYRQVGPDTYALDPAELVKFSTGTSGGTVVGGSYFIPTVAVPEPSAWTITVLGLVAVVACRIRRSRGRRPSATGIGS